MESNMQNLSLSGNAPPNKLGLLPLAAKKQRNTEKGTKVLVETNIRRLTIAPNQPIYKYAVEVKYFYSKADGSEIAVEMSKSVKKGTEHDNDKTRCQKVYNEAIKRYDALKTGGPFFYDRQASLYTLSKLKNENISFDVVEGISKRPNFKKAQFVLKKVDESFQSTSNDIKKTVHPCPANADKTLLEALNIVVSGPAYENKNVITIGSCVHYLIDTAGVDINFKNYQEGYLYSGVGASKAVKTLEGSDRKEPSLFMTTESELACKKRTRTVFFTVKTTLFHPDYYPLLEVMKSYKGFATNLKANSFAAQRIEKAFVGLDVVLDYGPHKGLQEDGVVMNIRKFGTTASETTFELGGKNTTVFNYFKTKYGITLKYPDLFTVEAKGKKGKIHIPVEVLLLCPSQTVTNDQMINNEQADMIKLSAAKPQVRKATTDCIVKKVGLASNNIYNFIKVEEPIKVEGMVLNKPKIVFAENKMAVLNDPRAKFPTDFNRAGKYYIAKELTNWEIVFVQGEDMPGLDKILVEEMKNNGMKAAMPATSTIVRGDLEPIFKKAKDAKRQLLFFVIKSRYNYHQQIKALEQQYDLLTQEVRAETAEKVPRQSQTRLNIVNKTNMKLGGLNYVIGSESFNKPGRLIVGFETSQRSGGNPDLNETFRQHVKDACISLSETYRPNFTIIASSKTHNERLYKSDKGQILNLEPGTVIDHTIVSPVYNEWYHASAAARQGTTKATKFTLIFTTQPAEPMWNLQQLTNDLCYDHQIVFHPVGLPVPLFIAGRYSQRGAMVLAANDGPKYKDGQVDLQETNKELGYGGKKLFETRFNA
ncbi:hypothetical protein CAEBREN_29326 [Caenorhabditis brenneri]|uniref:PAZ domain-containing protein n=1 Tax=Caenorhabditis brenneri TaxID=135651 RepID=G0PDS6_CAEBE|nr:hypothetical protein CAEBREN_29326 [Caenorhabditis brenneri]